MTEINKQLDLWRESRNLTRENQRSVFLANALSEFEEYQEAMTDEDSVDAICDMLIVTLNSFNIPALGIPSKKFLYNLIIYVDAGTKKPDDLAASLWKLLEDKGYNPELALMETIKEISSRRQDPKQAEQWRLHGARGKWHKDKNQPKDTLYKANYDNARIIK